MKTITPRFSKRWDDDPCTIGSTLGRYFLWIAGTMLAALPGVILSMILISRTAAPVEQEMTQRLIAILCTGLPVLFFALFFLFYKREDPCKARFFGILCAILMMVSVGIFMEVQTACLMEKAALLSVEATAFEAERKTGMDVFSVVMIILAMGVYFIGPFRLMLKERRQRKKSAEDFGVH